MQVVQRQVEVEVDVERCVDEPPAFESSAFARDPSHSTCVGVQHTS